MYIVKDNAQKIRMECRNKQSVLATLTMFAGLFGSRQENIQIENVKTGTTMTYTEFCSQQ